MKGKLIKTTKGYSLLDSAEDVIAKTQDKPNEVIKYQLSLKNCQTIANGYDLDELAYTDSEDFVDNFDYNDGYGNICRFNNSHEVQECYIKGFQKALEILGDKKFSEDDIRKVIDKTLYSWNSTAKTELDEKNDMIQSLQQTEWDVTFDPEKLDADGCLILYRI